MIPGEYILRKEDIELNVGRETVEVAVKNTSDRPIQIGSLIH
jgi:urease beta subunit